MDIIQITNLFTQWNEFLGQPFGFYLSNIQTKINSLQQFSQAIKMKFQMESMNFCYDYNLYNLCLPFFPDFPPFPSSIPALNNSQIIPQKINENYEEDNQKIKKRGSRVREIPCKQQFDQQASLNPPIKLTIEGRKNQTDSFTEKRNIIPNNINHILAFIQRKSKSGPTVKKAIEKYAPKTSFTANRFYCYQTYLKQKLYVHVNKSTLSTVLNHLNLHSDLFSVDEQLFYNKICRILVYYYLRQKSMMVILSSHRVKQTSKIDHLRAQRSLLKFMEGVDHLQ